MLAVLEKHTNFILPDILATYSISYNQKFLHAHRLLETKALRRAQVYLFAAESAKKFKVA
jgi:hypothetical protein